MSLKYGKYWTHGWKLLLTGPKHVSMREIYSGSLMRLEACKKMSDFILKWGESVFDIVLIKPSLYVK